MRHPEAVRVPSTLDHPPMLLSKARHRSPVRSQSSRNSTGFLRSVMCSASAYDIRIFNVAVLLGLSFLALLM